MRQFTRLTNAFSKKIENHVCAIALHCMFYNYSRIHQILKITPGDGCWGHDATLGNDRHRRSDRCLGS